MRSVRIVVVGLLAVCSSLVFAVAPSNAAAVSLSINDVVVNEPNWPDWEAPAEFTVSLSKPSTKPVSVRWVTSQPANPTDPEFRAAAGSLTIAPGVQQASIVVTVLRERGYHDDRHFTVTLSAPVGASLADAVGDGTILNTDRAGRFGCKAWADGVNQQLVNGGGGVSTSVPSGPYYAGYELECNYPASYRHEYRTMDIPGGAGSISLTTFHGAAVPTPRANYSHDTRVYPDDGADAWSEAADVVITAPGLVVRMETARAATEARCMSTAPPTLTSAGVITGLTVNGQAYPDITDHRIYELPGNATLELNRETSVTDFFGFERLKRDAVVFTHATGQPGYVVISHAEVASRGNPCTS